MTYKQKIYCERVGSLNGQLNLLHDLIGRLIIDKKDINLPYLDSIAFELKNQLKELTQNPVV